MTTGYYNEDSIWVAPYEAHQEEERLNSLIFQVQQELLLNTTDRKFMIEHGYNPDTGLSIDE